MTDVISLLQRLSSHKAAGTSSTHVLPSVDSEEHQQEEDGMSFEELERRRQFGGARLPPPPPRPQPAPSATTPATPAKKEELPPPPPKRANKNRPIEQSSKKAVPRFRDVLQVGNKGSVDPRFASGVEEPAARTSTKELWRKRYAFVFDEVLPEEKQDAQRALAKVKSSRNKAEIQQQLRSVQSQMQAERDRRKRDEREENIKAAQREARKQGKNPYYLKKSDKRKLELLERYKELSSAGKVDQYLEKRRKRSAAKDHKLVPSTRRSAMGAE